MQPFSPSLTPTLLSHTHLKRESAAVAALPEALAQWTGLELPPVLHDGWCLCLSACVGGSRCLSLPVPGLNARFLSPHLLACLCLLCIHPSIHLCSPLSLPHFIFCFSPCWRVKAIVGPSGVEFCSPAAASFPHGPCKTRLLLPKGPQASAALPPNKFAVTLSAIGPWIGSK